MNQDIPVDGESTVVNIETSAHESTTAPETVAPDTVDSGNVASPLDADAKDASVEPGGSVAQTAVRKFLAGSYSSIAVVGGILFFMPWMSLSCVGVDESHQTGYDIMTGNRTANPNFAAEFNAKMRDARQPPGKDDSEFKKDLESKRQEALSTRKDKMPAVEWLVFYPVGLLLVAAFGPIVVLARQPVRPFVPFVGAVFAALAISGTLMYEYPIERSFKMQTTAPDPTGCVKYLGLYESPAYQYVVWITFTTLGLVVAHYLFEIVTAKRRVSRPLNTPG